MSYIQPMNTNRMMMCSLDSIVDPESIVRVIDTFVDGLDLAELQFRRIIAVKEGCLPYAPGSMLKMYL